MSVVVGYGPNTPGEASLNLGALLARSTGAPLVVCCVVPDRWEAPGLDRTNEEYLQALRAAADQTLERAREALHQAHDATFTVRTGRSVPRTLLDEAYARGALIAVVGSSPHGAWGHVALGSVNSRILHSAEIPVALAPRGFRAVGHETVRRVTVGLDGTEHSHQVLRQASELAGRMHARLRAVTFAVRGRTMIPPETGLHAEDAVVAAWREQATVGLQGAVDALAEIDDAVTPEESRVVDGRGWADALERVGWQDGDLLAVGSSTSGVVSRVFLGSTATRIVRNAAVPVVLLPRSE